jgi:hypothetical protein
MSLPVWCAFPIMIKLPSSLRKPFYAIAGLSVVTSLLLIQSGYPITQQMRNLKVAGNHAPIINALLQHDMRFAKVQAGSWTGEGGCISIFGELNSESDLPDLKKIVELSKPPLRVLYGLRTPTGEHIPVDRDSE